MRRTPVALLLLPVAMLACGCGKPRPATETGRATGTSTATAPVTPPAASARPPAVDGATPAASPTAEPDTGRTLRRVAQRFNDDYDANNDGPVYDRWDARSRAVLSRADYIRRHVECSTAPQAPARVESVAPAAHGEWLVRYEIGGQQFTDYWFYRRGHWVFDLLLSNPDAARQYALPFAKYAAAVGCHPG